MRAGQVSILFTDTVKLFVVTRREASV